MRVLIMTPSYAPVIGGLQTISHALSCELIKRGHDVRVVANRYPRALPARDVIDGVFIRRMLFIRPSWVYLRGRLDLGLASIFLYPVSLLRLAWFVAVFKPEVINLHAPSNLNAFVLRLRRIFRFRLVVSLHGDETLRWSDPTRGRDGEKLYRRILREADAITACSAFMRELAVSMEPGIAHKARTIVNGIETGRYSRIPKRGEPSRRRPYVLGYGRLVSRKGFDLLISAFAQVAARHEGTDLLIAGEGEELERLQEQTRALNLTDRVVFYGPARGDQVADLLFDCAFVAIPSRMEPFGVVALEAMAAGKRVLAARVGGLADLTDDRINLGVEPTVEALALKLDEWLSNPEEVAALGTLNPPRAAVFSLARMVDHYLEAYAGTAATPIAALA